MSDERALFESWYLWRYGEMPNDADEQEFETFKSIRQWVARKLTPAAGAERSGEDAK